MLESRGHARSGFVTLTYSDEHLPAGGSLNPVHLSLWLKRFRKHVDPVQIRYFAVGEYGDQSGRPHYHVALFGLSCFASAPDRGGCRCVTCCGVRETWGFGHILIRELDPLTARYIAGYTAKKLTKKGDPALLGRSPEFARMSRRPGIGVDALWDVASCLLGLVSEPSDVPAALINGNHALPLGGFLRRRLREYVGRSPRAPEETLIAAQADVLALLEVARDIAPWAPGEVRKAQVLSMIDAANEGRRARFAYKKKGVL